MDLFITLQCALLAAILLPATFLWRRLTSSVRLLDGPKSTSWWRGNLGQIYARDGWRFHRELVDKYGGAVKIHGLFGCHQVYVSDPKAMHHMLVKDAAIYEETTWYIEGNMLVFGPGLLSTTGNHHRKQRRMLNPVFSIKNIRNLTPVFYTVIQKLQGAIAYQVKGGAGEVDMLMWMSRAALEVVGTGVLGTSIDSLDPDPNTITAYGKSIKNLIPSAFRLSMFRFFVPYLIKLGSPSFRRFLLEIAPSADLQKVKTIVDTMEETSNGIFREKLAAIAKCDDGVITQLGEGTDVMSTLLKANTLAASEHKLPDNELIAQMSTFMFAGHDTTSSALSRIFYELSQRQDVQDRLRLEIIESDIVYGDQVDYDELMTLPYLDAVCRETLRVHPPINFMARTARKDVTLPLGTPARSTDGQLLDHLCIRKGQNLIVAFGSTNRLKSVWGEDAYEWKPERWLQPLPESVSDAKISGVYSNLMTFSAGPRSCIGFKYAELEMKLTVCVLLRSFKFSLPKGKKVVWNLGGIQTPSIEGGETGMPTMPLWVERV